MKKLIAMMRKLLALLLAWLLCAPALAEETIVLPDAVVNYDVPAGAYVLSRESSASVFSRIGLSQREILPWMEQNDMYLWVIGLDEGWEAYVMLYPAEPYALEDMTEPQLAQLCEATAEAMEENGYIGTEVVIHDSPAYRFVQRMIPMENIDGSGNVSASLLTYQQGYCLAVEGYMPAGDENALTAILTLTDSLRIVLPEGVTALNAHGVSIRMNLPAGMVMLADLPEAPEAAAGEVIGAAAPEDGGWFVQWQLIEGAKGDLERVSESGLRSLYEDRARRKASAGFTVTLREACTDLRQKYVHLRYEIPGGWFAEEYYTKQGGWGIVVTAYSEGQPLTEEASAMLRELISTQLITVWAD